MENTQPQIDEPEVTPATTETKPKKSYKGIFRVFVWLLVFLLIIAPAAAALWFIYQQQSQLQTLQTEVAELSGLASQIDTIKSTTQQSQQNITTIEERLGNSLQRQQASILELQKKSPLTNAEIEFKWALSEVEYLLQLANQRSTLAKDVEGALTALTLADDVLRELDDYRLQALRELIAEESLALSSRSKTDIGGMTAQLIGVTQAVDTLRVVKGPKQFVRQPADTDNALSGVAWRDALNDLWQQVRSLVVIRQQEGVPQAVLMPEQRYFLYQNLKLQLETARFALLSSDQSTFENSLTSAIDWLTQYFTGDERDAMLSSLQALKTERITVDMPDISASLRWIQRFEP